MLKSEFAQQPASIHTHQHTLALQKRVKNYRVRKGRYWADIPLLRLKNQNAFQ